MKSIEPTLEYHELLMTLDNLEGNYYLPLPKGYSFEFWKGKECINDWIRIHLETGEFASKKFAEEVFHSYYDKMGDNISKYCFFITNENGEKIATATVSPANEFGYPCVFDWVAVSGKAQGRGLAKPLISRTILLAKELGFNKILLHTQTTTWLAAKLYLDFGFKPFKTNEDGKGWRILRTITNHKVLQNFKSLPEKEMYDELMLNVKAELDKLHKEYHFSVWYIDGHNDVYVNENGNFFEYKFFDNGKKLEK